MADGTCTWNIDWNPLNDGTFGACVGETQVPAGCPIHVLVPKGDNVAASPSTPAITIATTYVDTQTVGIAVAMCGEYTSASQTYDRVVVTASGAQLGDFIQFSSAGAAANESSVRIGSAGPCAATTWPSDFEEYVAYDDCPMPAAAHRGGCATAGDASWAALAIVVGGVVARRR